MKIAAVVEEGFSASGTFINITISEMGKSIEEIGRIVSECDKFTVHNNVFGTNKIAFCTAEANPQNIAVSSHIVEFCSLIPSAPTEEMLLFLCKEMTRVWEEDEITQSQLLTDIRYIINQAIKKSLSAVASVPDASEIVSNSGNFKSLLNKLTQVMKIIFDIHKNTHEKRSQILIEKVKQYLDDNFTQAIVYKNFYDIFGYNEKYITMLFRSAYGISPSKYVIMRRIELAKHIMKSNQKIQVKDVAEMVGIPDPFYFSKIFKHREGLSPSVYLKNI